jgi:hypothetical protein
MGGIQPELREYLEGVEDALNGDVLMDISPSATGSDPTTADFTRDVTITIVNAAGETLEWVNAAFTTTASIAEVTNGNGAASIASTTLTLVDGVAVITVSCTGTWIENDTSTLTIANIILAGVTVTAGTSIDTIVAA